MNSSTKTPLGILDHFCPPNYTAFSWYIPLKESVTYTEAFDILEKGLRLTFKQLPWLSGKIFKQAPTTPGWRPGQLEIRYDPDTGLDETGPLPQLKFKVLDGKSATRAYQEIKESGFPMNSFSDNEILWGTYIQFPEVDQGADCYKAQANFLPGAVLLCAAAHHNVCDGTSQFDIWRMWAANCESLQSGTQTPMPDPASSDRQIIHQIWSIESGNKAKSRKDFHRIAWTLLDIDPPEITPRPQPDLCFNETMQSTIFYMSPKNYAALHKQCVEESGGSGPHISSNDSMTALVWRCLLKARRAAALKARRVSEADLGFSEARLQLTLDGRPNISRKGAMPLVYLGNVVYMNLCVMSLTELTAKDTTIGSIARAIRRVAEAATSQAMLDAYTLAHENDDLASLGLRVSPIRDFDMILSPLIAFPVETIRWGSNIFANGGKPDSMRPLWDDINAVARLCFPLPRKTGAGIEFVVNLFPDELEILLEDEEFGRFAYFLAP